MQSQEEAAATCVLLDAWIYCLYVVAAAAEAVAAAAEEQMGAVMGKNY